MKVRVFFAEAEGLDSNSLQELGRTFAAALGAANPPRAIEAAQPLPAAPAQLAAELEPEISTARVVRKAVVRTRVAPTPAGEVKMCCKDCSYDAPPGTDGRSRCPKCHGRWDKVPAKAGAGGDLSGFRDGG